MPPRPSSRRRSGRRWPGEARGGHAQRARCSGRIGVNERPMKLTRNSTTSSAITPGSATMARKPGAAAAPWLSARAALLVERRAAGRARARTPPRSTRKCAGCRSCRRGGRPRSRPWWAERICAAWMRPTARPVSSRGAGAVAIASPRGPMPPKSPMPMRRTERLLDARDDRAEGEDAPRRRRAPSPRRPCARGGRRGGPRRERGGRRRAGRRR